MTSKIHPIFLHYLKEIEPDSEFSGSLPRIESSSGKAYYAKLGSESEAEQWAGEAEALRAMHTAAPGLAPHLLAFGTIDKSGNEVESGGRPFFVSEFLNLGQLDDKAAAKLGKRLASEMHSFKSSHGFGFAVPTYCGATRLSNGWHGSWEECFNSMVGELLGYLQDRGRFTSLCKKGRQLQNKVIPQLLGPLVIQPVLLHGDLWSGNTGINRATGEPVIFDPASYFGHNEADLGIARMFGGIPESFFTAYHNELPKSEPVADYDKRVDLYKLFHYLNHTVLFGSGYASQAESLIDKLLLASDQ